MNLPDYPTYPKGAVVGDLQKATARIRNLSGGWTQYSIKISAVGEIGGICKSTDIAATLAVFLPQGGLDYQTTVTEWAVQAAKDGVTVVPAVGEVVA